jgi:uncharacterized membrane protein YdjX (TVP38/TMEM64 family)
MSSQLIESIRDKRDRFEDEVRRCYQSSVKDSGEFEAMIEDVKKGESIPLFIIRFLPAEVAGFVSAAMELHEAELKAFRK